MWGEVFPERQLDNFIPRGRDPASPNFLGLLHIAHCITNNNLILHYDQTRLDKRFYRIDHPPTLAKNFVTNAGMRSVYGS